MISLIDLAIELDERELSLQIHAGFHVWVVWLYPPDDPSLLCSAEDDDLATAINAALAKWDGAKEKSS